MGRVWKKQLERTHGSGERGAFEAEFERKSRNVGFRSTSAAGEGSGSAYLVSTWPLRGGGAPRFPAKCPDRRDYIRTKTIITPKVHAERLSCFKKTASTNVTIVANIVQTSHVTDQREQPRIDLLANAGSNLAMVRPAKAARADASRLNA